MSQRPVKSGLFFLIFFLLLAACTKKEVEFRTYADPAGSFTLEVPQDWAQESNNGRPVAVSSFPGQVIARDGETPLGAILYVTRFYRQRKDHPGDDGAYRAYLRDILLYLDVLFGASPDRIPEANRRLLPAAVQETELSGLPAKTYRRDFEHFNPLHMRKPYPMRLEDVVVRTPEVYYLLEYRATRDLFDDYYFAFEKAKATFKLVTDSGG